MYSDSSKHNTSSNTSTPNQSSSWLTDRLRGFDAHSSVENEFRVYTHQGAVLSVFTVLVIVYLVVTEFWFNFQVVTTEQVHVNATSPAGLELEFDLSFFDVPCDQLSIDANDPTGQVQSLHLDRNHHVWKHRVVFPKKRGAKRTLLGSKMKLEFGSTLKSLDDLQEQETPSVGGDGDDANGTTVADNNNQNEEPVCGSCFGAASEEDECCNTCDDVERAYKRKGWILRDYHDIPVCAHKAMQKTERDEGCNVHGVVALSTGGGNLHLTPSKTALEQQIDGAATTTPDNTRDFIMNLLMGQLQKWNVSHQIHKLRFGPEYPAAVDQLDEQTRSISDTYGMYQYYFQVVPTTYKFLNGTVIQTNQYSVTEHLRHVDFGSTRGYVGCCFYFHSFCAIVVVTCVDKVWKETLLLFVSLRVCLCSIVHVTHSIVSFLLCFFIHSLPFGTFSLPTTVFLVSFSFTKFHLCM